MKGLIVTLLTVFGFALVSASVDACPNHKSAMADGAEKTEKVSKDEKSSEKEIDLKDYRNKEIEERKSGSSVGIAPVDVNEGNEEIHKDRDAIKKKESEPDDEE